MIKLNSLPDLIKFCATIGNLPTSYMQSLSYEEQLLWLLDFLNKTILPTMKQTIESIEELEDWFNNLDVQEEINNKLEEMAESGELEEIISTYLNSKAIFGYDTVADMISATNLINGSYARTMGYYEKNDGGSALYKIREVINTDVTNGGSLIAMENDSLVAELIPEGSINVIQFGCIGDGETDNNEQLQKVFDYAENNVNEVFIPKGNFFSSLAISIKGNITITGIKGSQLSFPTVLQEALVPDNNCSFNIKNVKIKTLRGTAVHISHTGNKNCLVDNCDIDSKGFGVLVEQYTDGGENLHITNNNISVDADSIEINSINQTSDKFKDIVISNNILETRESEVGNNPSGSGFAVGVATGKNITITNNVIKKSRREAIHIEDGSENIIVSDNVLNNCKTDGIILYGVDSKSTVEPLIRNNVINSESNNKSTGNGIYIGYSPNGSYKWLNLIGNQIKGFKSAFRIDDRRTKGLFDNNEIINCGEVFYSTGLLPERVSGKIIMRNTGVIHKSDNTNQMYISTLDYVSADYLDKDNWLKVSSNGTVNIKHLDFKVEYQPSATADYHVIKLFKIPTHFNGTIELSLQQDQTVSKAINTVSIATDNTITKTELYKVNAGTIGTPSFIKTDDNYLAIQVYIPNLQTSQTLNCYIAFDGNLVLGNSYNI